MHGTRPNSSAQAAARAPGENRLSEYRFSRWKLVLLACAGVLVVVGSILRLTATDGDPHVTRVPSTVEPNPNGPGPESAFAPRSGSGPVDWPPSSPSDADSDPTPAAATWSPAFLRGGFGFFMGFCIGFAMRLFVRMAAVVIGFNLLAIAWFSYLGWVDVRWDIVQAQLDGWFTGLRDEFASFQAFLAGSLPSTALGGLGLFTGLKRK